MKTTVSIPDGVLEEARRHCGATTKCEAVVKALEELNRRHRMARLAKKLGTLEHLMTRKELERLREDGEGRQRDSR